MSRGYPFEIERLAFSIPPAVAPGGETGHGEVRGRGDNGIRDTFLRPRNEVNQMSTACGINERVILDTPMAILDFETTGLVAGVDRVVEISVLQVDPGKPPRFALDTLVNPMRPMAATEIHGITDADVANAPRFSDIAGELIGALSNRVLAAYNVYFDMKFLSFELQNMGIDHESPHFCLMYMRPMLGLGPRCRLEEACRLHGIDHSISHYAGHDVEASGKLLSCYLEVINGRGIRTFGDLAGLKRYKFVESFEQDPFPSPSHFRLVSCDRLCSRLGHVHVPAVDPSRHALSAYWDVIRTVVADLDIADEETQSVQDERNRLGLTVEQIRSVHAKAFASAIVQFIEDKSIDQKEVAKLQRLHRCLSKLGWAPGE